MLEFIHIESIAADLFQRWDQGFQLFGYGSRMGIGYLTDTAVGFDTQKRRLEFIGVPGKPILHVPALVGVVDQHIGFGYRFDAFISSRQGSNTFKISTHIGREIRAYGGRVAPGIGLGDHIGGHLGGAQHGTVVFREIDQKPH